MDAMTQLNIKSPEARDLALELADLTGESLTSAVTKALRERLERERHQKEVDARVAKILEMSRQYAAWPEGDPRTADEIIGCDENGAPE